jgi:hypothetical protein
MMRRRKSVMKLAILMLCHKNAEQINLFLDILKHPDIEFFIHMDKKVNIVNQLTKRPDIHVLSDTFRVDVKWSGFSMIEATLNMLKAAHKFRKYDYYWLCSGQDFPLVSAGRIITYFKTHPDKNFVSLSPSFNYSNSHHENHLDKRNIMRYPSFLMECTLFKRILKRTYIELSGGWNNTYTAFRRKDKFSTVHFYFGPQWIAITNDFVRWLLTYLKVNPWYEDGYRSSLTPDESFFQTLLMMSPYKKTRHDYLHYIDWSACEGKPENSPNTLTMGDYDNMKSSGYLMARKLDITVD